MPRDKAEVRQDQNAERRHRDAERDTLGIFDERVFFGGSHKLRSNVAVTAVVEGDHTVQNQCAEKRKPNDP